MVDDTEAGLPAGGLTTGDAIWKIYRDLRPWPQLIALFLFLAALRLLYALNAHR
jgi:hypothetical protein